MLAGARGTGARSSPSAIWVAVFANALSSEAADLKVRTTSMLHVLLERHEDLDELDRGRSDRDDPDRGEDAEHQREHHLDAGFGGGLFGTLPPLRAQRLRMDAQRLGDAR